MPEWVLAPWLVYSASAAIAARDACCAGAGREGRRIELLEADGLDAARRGDRNDLAPERVEHDEAPRVGEILRHRVVGQRGREQHRAIGELAPEIAPDVVGQHRVGLEQFAAARASSRVRSRIVPSISPTTTAPRLPNRICARAVPVGAEIDEAAHRALRADASAIASSLRPFCAESTKPSGARCGSSCSSAASVARRLHGEHDAPVRAA